MDARRVLATISGMVFEDINENGVQDAGDTGLDDRIVFIDVNNNGQVNRGEPVQPTSNGSYQFNNLPPQLTPYVVRIFNGTTTQSVTTSEFEFVAIDSDQQTSNVSFGMSLHGDNTAPDLKPDTNTKTAPLYSVITQDTAFINPSPIGLKSVAQDPDHRFGVSDEFIVIQLTESQGGDIQIHPDGGFEYDDQIGFIGEDTATFVYHDGRTRSEERDVVVNVVPRDESGAVVFEGDPLLENPPAGALVGAINVVDPNGVFDIEILDPRFQLNGAGLLIVAADADIDFEEANHIRLDLIVRNEQNNDFFNDEIIIPLVNVDDPVESFTVTLEAESFTERIPGLLIGTFAIADQDGGKYNISVDDERFIASQENQASGSISLAPGASLDFVKDNGATITVTLDDSNNEPTTTSFTLNVINVDDPPSGINLSGQLLEHVFGGTVGEITVIDPDPDDEYVLTVSDTRFEVASGILKLVDGIAVDREVEQIIPIEVVATKEGSPPVTIEREFDIVVKENNAPFQNSVHNQDVDNDGVVEPQDALIILNELNESGPRPLDGPFNDGDPFLDVNGDGLLTPLDALIVVNDLNHGALNGDGAEPEQQDVLPGPQPEGEAGSEIRYAVAPQSQINSNSARDAAIESEDDWRFGLGNNFI